MNVHWSTRIVEWSTCLHCTHMLAPLRLSTMTVVTETAIVTDDVIAASPFLSTTCSPTGRFFFRTVANWMLFYSCVIFDKSVINMKLKWFVEILLFTANLNFQFVPFSVNAAGYYVLVLYTAQYNIQILSKKIFIQNIPIQLSIYEYSLKCRQQINSVRINFRSVTGNIGYFLRSFLSYEGSLLV